MNTETLAELTEQYKILSKKLLDAKPKTIGNPQESLPYFLDIVEKDQEHFKVLFLDGSHSVIDERIVTIGLVNFCQVHPREVFRPAIACNAVAIICAHNHPSGKLTPSEEDRAMTKRLKSAGDVVGIKLIDHVIVGRQSGFYSFATEGDLF